MNKRIKKLLISELSSKRKIAQFLNWDLPNIVWRRKSNKSDKCFYMLDSDEYNIFHFETWVRLDNATFYLKETESYTIDDLKQDLDLSESWFEPFIINEE